MRRKKWVVSPCSKDFASQIAEKFGINPFAALLVAAGGLDSSEKIESFFDADAPLTVDPYSLKDMDKAVKRIEKAIDSFEKIAIFGDYDADGITASALLYSYLETRGANVVRYIPDRLVEGYGLSVEAVESLARDEVKLIITVDNGVSAIEEAKKAAELGVDLIITDHHKVPAEIPQAVAVVDPHRQDCGSTFKDFAGVGVAFELALALEGTEGADTLLEEYGDLAAIGTIGDVVSLTGENRTIVRRGLEMMNTCPRVGIAALMDKAGAAEKAVTSSLAAFTVCPRINAAGRMGLADKALDLLLCEDEEIAQELAQNIQDLNLLRQKTEAEIFREAMQQLADSPERMLDNVIVVDCEDWHQGVIGIVASKLTEQFGRPAVVISRSGDKAKGSCRSVEGFSIFDAIESVSSCLMHFGGHPLAAGIALESNRIEEFRYRINEYADGAEMPFAVQRIDCRIHPRSISLEILDAMDLLEPFGAGNPQPCFGLFGVRIDDITPISEGRHLRLTVSKGGARTAALCFGMQEKNFPYAKGDVVDLAVNLDRNVYNHEVRVSVIVRNIRPSETDEETVLSQLRLFDRIMHGSRLTAEQAASALPERALQVEVFRYIKANALQDSSCEVMCLRLGDNGSKLCAAAVCVEMMLEMGILNKDSGGVIAVSDNPVKVNLEDSKLYQRIKSFV